MTVCLIFLLNLLVGVCVGLTGIAGFLLPMFYSGFLGMRPSEALALSFSAFLVSGILGSWNYHRAGNLDLHSGLILSAGSLFGAILGVRINLLIPDHTVQMILYLVVLFSGISILLRREPAAVKNDKKRTGSGRNLLYIILGAVTSSICAASGAGGPVLVMPLLTVIGFPVHTAVGVALFNSIFIAVVAASGYLFNASFSRELWILFPWILISHGIGVLYGSKHAAQINQKLLKRIVAVASILIALFKLL